MKVFPKKARVLPMLAAVFCLFFLSVIAFPALAEIKTNYLLAFVMAEMDNRDVVLEKSEKIVEAMPCGHGIPKTGFDIPSQSQNTFFDFFTPISPSPVLRC